VSSNFETPSHPLPKPVSAYVGLLLAAVEDTREPGASIVARIARLPIATFGQLLTARQRYDELAQQGDVVIDAVVGMVRHSLGRDSDDGDEPAFEDDSGWAAADFADAGVTSITDRSPSPLQQLEEFSVPEEIGAQAGGLKDAKDLPLEDFDHMTAPQLRGRLRRLDRVQLVQLLDYERAHAHRVPIVVMLENRLTKLLEEQA
jgi:hypothetical protein